VAARRSARRWWAWREARRQSAHCVGSASELQRAAARAGGHGCWRGAAGEHALMRSRCPP
jgi:hypothetical protein